jgi:hypothetical protein
MPAQPAQAAVPHPLDEVPQTFRAGDPYAVRDALVHYIRRDLLGPWDGETETLPTATSGPRDRYLVGVLGPRPQAVTADRMPGRPHRARTASRATNRRATTAVCRTG